MAALVRCSSGQHTFEINVSQTVGLLSNACMNDRRIVPSACHLCCYPDVDVTFTSLLRSTVFHRLASLQGLYSRVNFHGDFDPEGRRVERYSCGESFSDGTGHPPFRISWRNLQRAGRYRPANHLCLACGALAGQVGSRSKRLQELEALMRVMRDELHRGASLRVTLQPPVVKYVSGPMDPVTQEISTTKTQLSFWCGHPTHAPSTANKDYYFNRAPSRGYGFCKLCVIEVGLAKAPLPSVHSGPQRALRPCTLRRYK